MGYRPFVFFLFFLRRVRPGVLVWRWGGSAFFSFFAACPLRMSSSSFFTEGFCSPPDAPEEEPLLGEEGF